MRLLSKFRREEDGGIVLWFGLGMLVVCATVGAALDYGRAITTRQAMQNTADLTAIQLATSTNPATYTAQDLIKTGIYQNKNAAQDVTFNGHWASPTDFEVEGNGNVPTSVLAAVPGIDRLMAVKVKAIARVNMKYVSKTPKMASLDPEAADYNQIYVYCFEPAGAGLGANGNKGAGIEAKRTQMTLIADNAGSKFDFVMPACAAGQNLSIRLRNVRNMRTSPSLWNSNVPEQYNWYSDSTRTPGGVEKYNFEENVPILETVICPTLNECKPQGQGGIIEEGKNRNPKAATRACQKGEFVYYGFEDRPPGKGSTDKDYDDIRLIMECPETTGTKQVKLVE
jgi:Flp pilus assembly protein TadG